MEHLSLTPKNLILLETNLLSPNEPSQQDIILYAQHLGMDISQDKNLLYIAKEALIAPLPNNWKKCELNGEIGYYNILTKQIIKDHPLDKLYKKHYFEIKTLNSFENKENLSIQNNKNAVNLQYKDNDVKEFNENLMKQLALEYQIKIKEYEDFKINEFKLKENEIKQKAFLDDNLVNNSKFKEKEMEYFNEEVEKVKAIRKKEYDERKRILQLKIDSLVSKKQEIIHLKEKHHKEMERILQLEKIKLDEKFQINVNEMHMKLMNNFSKQMNSCINELEIKLKENKNDIYRKKTNEKRIHLAQIYEQLYQNKIKELEKNYNENCKYYEEEELKNVEQIANYEYQKEKFNIIQNKINEINYERLKLDENISEKIESSDNYVCRVNEKIQKTKDLTKDINILEKEIKKNPQDCVLSLQKYEATINDLNQKITKTNDENELLQIELISIMNKLEDVEQSNNESNYLEQNKNQTEFKELHQTLEKLDQEITILKEKKQGNMCFGDTTEKIQQNSFQNENSFELSNLKKNFPFGGFVKVPLKLLKKKDYPEKSFISLKNDESYLSDILSKDHPQTNKIINDKTISLQGKSPKSKSNGSNRIEILNLKKNVTNQNILEIKKDWNQIFILEKEKIQLLCDNLKKEKVIFDNRHKEEDWIAQNNKESKKVSVENYKKYIQKNRGILKLEVVKLKMTEKKIKTKKLTLKKIEKLFFSLNSSEKEDLIMERAYQEYKQIDIKLINTDQNLEMKSETEDLNLSGLTVSDDLDFYQYWIKSLNQESSQIISPYKYEEEDNFLNQSKEEFICKFYQNTSNHNHNLNFSLDRGRNYKSKRINSSFQLENRSTTTTIVQSNYSRSSKEIMKNLFKDHKILDSRFSQHTKWLSSLKSQLSSNYYSKPYDSVVKKFSSSNLLKKL